jgi:predicted metal-dependent peptidase
MDNKRIRLKGKMKRGKYKMGVIIDTSASISQEILTQYVSVIYQLFSKNKKKLIIDILQNDVSMTKIDKNVTINQIKEYQIIGRGGTELSESFEYVKNHKYDLCLVLTDGLLSEKIEPLNIPTTILLEDKKYEDHLLKVLKDWKWKNGNIIYLNQEVNNYE